MEDNKQEKGVALSDKDNSNQASPTQHDMPEGVKALQDRVDGTEYRNDLGDKAKASLLRSSPAVSAKLVEWSRNNRDADVKIIEELFANDHAVADREQWNQHNIVIDVASAFYRITVYMM